MGRAKLPRKSTTIDMTAMCDVAFLLLSFFILTTKFKPSEAIAVTTPSSVAAKKAPKKNFVMVTIDSDGKVFLSIDNRDIREKVIETVNLTKNLNANDNAFINADYIGTSFDKLSSFLSVPQEARIGEALPGIPCNDTKNELTEWIAAVNKAYDYKKYDLLLKGDNVSKYPSFKAVLNAFKDNNIFKFQIVTNPESVPKGSDLFYNPKSDKE
jgi:biopolymer transport protein ExbD